MHRAIWSVTWDLDAWLLLSDCYVTNDFILLLALKAILHLQYIQYILNLHRYSNMIKAYIFNASHKTCNEKQLDSKTIN